MSVRRVVTVLVAVAALPATAQAATITVSTEVDRRANDGECALREAIISANADAASGAASGECAAGSGADTIRVPAGFYALALAGEDDTAAAGDLDISSEL